MNRNLFGILVRDNLADQKKSAAWLAREAGISGAYVNDIIHGRRYPSGKVALRIGEVLGFKGHKEKVYRKFLKEELWKRWTLL